MCRKPLYRAIVDSLLDFHRKGSTGVLRVEDGAVKRQLLIRGGRLAFAESNQAEEHLARILVAQRIIGRQELPKIAALMKEGKSSDEAVLAACGVSPEVVASSAREQAITILASLLARHDGGLNAYHGDAFPARRMNLQADLPELILEAVRRAVATGKVPGTIKSLQGTVRPLETGRVTRAEIPLDRAECYACSLVPRQTRIETILPILEAADPKPMKLLQRLALLGLITPEESAHQENAQNHSLVSPESENPESELDLLLSRFEVAGHYEILGVPTNAGQDHIKNAYHELARRFHPDRFQSAMLLPVQAKAQKLFTYVTGAYAVLSDPAARVSYDGARAREESPVNGSKNTAGPDKGKMAETLFKSARAHLAKQEYEKAIAQFRECVWLCPEEAKYHHFLGVAQSELPRYRREAEKYLLKAVDLNNSGIESRLALGRLYIKANLAKKAQLQFEEVLRWDPGNPEALRMLTNAS